MKKSEIVKYLEELGQLLSDNGYTGEIILTGGAVMCLVHSARDMTKNVDAIYEPKSIINEYVNEIAQRNNLPKDWLNDSVKRFVDNNVQYTLFKKIKGLTINVVTPEYLLAMKLFSSRVGETDIYDIKFLFKKLNIKTMEQAMNILLKFYPENRILPKTKYVIEEIING